MTTLALTPSQQSASLETAYIVQSCLASTVSLAEEQALQGGGGDSTTCLWAEGLDPLRSVDPSLPVPRTPSSLSPSPTRTLSLFLSLSRSFNSTSHTRLPSSLFYFLAFFSACAPWLLTRRHLPTLSSRPQPGQAAVADISCPPSSPLPCSSPLRPRLRRRSMSSRCWDGRSAC